jgi:hypothetical protein
MIACGDRITALTELPSRSVQGKYTVNFTHNQEFYSQYAGTRIHICRESFRLFDMV